jgi:hypothetical protein
MLGKLGKWKADAEVGSAFTFSLAPSLTRAQRPLNRKPTRETSSTTNQKYMKIPGTFIRMRML